MRHERIAEQASSFSKIGYLTFLLISNVMNSQQSPCFFAMPVFKLLAIIVLI